jgi:dienelactone hydrolase
VSADCVEEPLTGRLQGVALRPAGASTCEVGVLVLAGSSGRLDLARARLLAEHGALVVALRWFGGPGQPPDICEVPLETFIEALGWLAEQGARRIGIVGLSRGAEAALLVACHDARVDTVIALAPTSVCWGYVEPGADGHAHAYRSSWTWRGAPAPFGPYDETWKPAETNGLVSYRALYEASLRAFPEARRAAAIPVEQARASLLLIAGKADALWPSALFAAEIAARRKAAGRQVEVITHPDAGHRPILPGEPVPAPSTAYAHGGSAAADAALGALVWPCIQALLYGREREAP